MRIIVLGFFITFLVAMLFWAWSTIEELVREHRKVTDVPESKQVDNE